MTETSNREQDHLGAINGLGLVRDEIVLHQQRVRRCLLEDQQSTIDVVDTCRLDNNGILKFDYIADSGELDQLEGRCLGFVPAAGAATRYAKGLTPLLDALHGRRAWTEVTQSLKEAGAASWVLPKVVREFLDSPKPPDDALAGELIQSIKQPKALYPCLNDGTSYLAMKHMEHEALGCLAGQVFVVAHGLTGLFEAHPSANCLTTEFLEQGPDMCTIRFDDSGQALRDSSGKPSVVSAGHGTLVKLFDGIARDRPGVDSLFIRNIDNVVGTDERVTRATRSFLGRHFQLLDFFKATRALLDAGDLDKADRLAGEFLKKVQFTTPMTNFSLPHGLTKKYGNLWRIQLNLIQVDRQVVRVLLEEESEPSALSYLYKRPVNSLGQVPNLGNDVGGTPVFCRSERGLQKVCLELPHASLDDQERFFRNPNKATHFNPVFVATELFDGCSGFYRDEGNPFWILAKKNFNNKQVYYHETVLYELLGNNQMSNAVFVEIPRFLFRPHKALADTAPATH